MFTEEDPPGEQNKLNSDPVQVEIPMASAVLVHDIVADTYGVHHIFPRLVQHISQPLTFGESIIQFKKNKFRTLIKLKYPIYVIIKS